MIFVSPVPIEDVGKVWDLCKPLLSQATDRSGGRETSLTLYSKIKSGSSQLWIIIVDGFPVASATTEVTVYKNLNVSFLGGSGMNVWLDEFINQLKIYAKHNNCSKIELFGRKGWLRELKPFGFKKEHYISMSLSL
jgi:hypothetical protein